MFQCSSRWFLEAHTLHLCLALLCWATLSCSACFFSVSFRHQSFFAHADWMKNWGKHQKQLSKTWFPFKQLAWCWLAFPEWIGETCMPVVYPCTLIIMLHFKSSLCPMTDVIPVIFFIFHTIVYLPPTPMILAIVLLLLFNFLKMYTCNFRYHSQRTHHRHCHV